MATRNNTARATKEDEVSRAQELRSQKLQALSTTIKDKRKDAIDGRNNSGIDKQWKEDIEFYEGIDDANRAEMTGDFGAYTSKPPGQIMPEGESDDSDGSTVFLNITRPYCDAAAARIGDMLMPTDDRAFGIKPTPVPELENMAKGQLSIETKKAMLAQVPTMDPQTGAPIPAEQQQGELSKILQDSIRQAEIVMEEAKGRSKKAQDRIDDWHVECQYHSEVRRVIDDAAKIGTGVLKGPVPSRQKHRQVRRDPQTGNLTLVVDTKINPISKRIDPRNLFPDAACGDNIHNGSHVFERDYLSRKRIEELKETPGYLKDQIEAVLAEGPKWAGHELPGDENKRDPNNKDLFEIWYFHGNINKEDLEAIGCSCEGDKPVNAILTLVNERVVKAARSHLDSDDFPYDVMNWQQVSGRWAGIGVSRQIRTPQRLINAGARNVMDNAGLTAGPQIVLKVGTIEPQDGNYTIHGRKVWIINEDADIQDVKQVFGVFNIEARQEELMRIVEFGLKMAEDVTGLPLLLQGQQGDAPDTLGGTKIVNDNASTVLRRLAKLFDDFITVPHVRRYYAWIMQYGEEAEKGDYTIDARGSSALVERDLQNQAIIQMGQLVTNPAFGINPRKWVVQYFKSQRLDPKEFQYTEDEQKKLDEMAQQGPTDPRVAVAQLRVEAEDRWNKMDAQLTQQLALVEQRFEANENAKDRMLEAWIQQMQQAGSKSVSLDTLKARLADTAIKSRLQRELSQQKNMQQTMKPPAEPRGKAPPGQAFAK
ncbi:MAG: hypothetical protein NUV75_11220 [Gallionella sp.]|nr:hypothetical protein [Gallionella sp.]